MLREGFIGESAVVWANGRLAIWRIGGEAREPVQKSARLKFWSNLSNITPTSGGHENQIQPGESSQLYIQYVWSGDFNCFNC